MISGCDNYSMGAAVEMKRRIRLLYVMDYFETPYGGTEGQLYNLIAGLDRDLFDAELCVYRHISDYFDKNSFPIPVSNLNITSFRKFSTYTSLLHLRRYIAENHFDIVQILFNDAALSVPLIGMGLKAKIIATRRDMGFWYTPAKLRLLRMYVPLTDMYIVNSLTVKQNVMEREGVPEKKIEVIYNAHDMSRFDVAANADFHREYNIPSGAKIVGIVSNIRPVKRVGDLIRAFPSVLAKIQDAYLVIIGDPGIYRQEYEELVSDLLINDHVRFLGMMDSSEIPSHVKCFHVGVICSESEGLSNAIIEYMGCGVPVVASDIPSNRELIENDGAGILYPMGDIAGLSQSIIDVLDHIRHGDCAAGVSRPGLIRRFDEADVKRQYQEKYMKLVNTY